MTVLATSELADVFDLGGVSPTWPLLRPADEADRRVAAAIESFAVGEMVLVSDDSDREDEGDLVLAAEHATAPALELMLKHTSGLLCVALDGSICDDLDLPPMVAHSTDRRGTAFTVSVDYLHGTGTGISAHDRATTARALVDPRTASRDLARPGHLFPLRAADGGLLRRRGHTEATVDLARLAGLRPGGVLCEVRDAAGRMASRRQLDSLATEMRINHITVAELVAYRLRHEPLVERAATASMPTRHGAFTAHGYRSRIDGAEHVALVAGDLAGPEPVQVRVHSECHTGDVLGSLRCDCGEQLDAALAAIGTAGRGVVVYLTGHEGRGIGLVDKLRAYALQDAGLDTVDANVQLGLPVDARDYSAAGQILRDLGVQRVRLLTNNPAKCRQLEDHGVEVVERVALWTSPQAANIHYLETKLRRMGHLPPVPLRPQG